VQWFGKEPVANVAQFNADLVSVCAHKFHGPKGAGLLYIKSPLHPDPILFGGGHENERRAGTENLAVIIGFVVALEKFVPVPVFSKEKLSPMAARLISLIDSLPNTHFAGSRAQRLSNTVSFLVEGADSISLLAALDLEGICASSGSACSAGSLEPSHVISALGVKPELANSLVRFSLGRENTLSEILIIEDLLPNIVSRSQPGQQPSLSL
jgi:cysteine desulfurase